MNFMGIFSSLNPWKGKKPEQGEGKKSFYENILTSEVVLLGMFVIACFSFYILVGNLFLFVLYCIIIVATAGIYTWLRFYAFDFQRFTGLIIIMFTIIFTVGFGSKFYTDKKDNYSGFGSYLYFLESTDRYTSCYDTYLKLKYFQELADKNISFKVIAGEQDWIYNKFRVMVTKSYGSKEDHYKLIVYYNMTLKTGVIDDWLQGDEITKRSIELPVLAIASVSNTPKQSEIGTSAPMNNLNYEQYYGALGNASAATTGTASAGSDVVVVPPNDGRIHSY